MTFAPQLGNIIRLLSSSIDGEAIAAVAAINRTLASHNLDIHDLAEVVDAGCVPGDLVVVSGWAIASFAISSWAHIGAADATPNFSPL